MNEEEALVMASLVKAWNDFLKLETTHPSHNADFSNAIHKCQDILIHKIVQRDYPHSFPTHS